MCKKIRHFCSFVFVLSALCVAGTFWTPVFAQGEPAIVFDENNFTEREKIGFAFYSLSTRREPDFLRWIRKSEKYRTARPMTRQRYLKRDKDRLGLGFLLYDRQKHFFYLNARVAVSWPEEAERNQMVAEKGKFPLKFTLLDTKEYFFPVSLGDDWVAVVPENLADFLTIYVTPEEFEKKIVQFQEFIDMRSVEGYVRFYMRALSADDGTKLALQDIEAWLLLAEVNRITVSPERLAPPVWEHRASWDQ